MLHHGIDDVLRRLLMLAVGVREREPGRLYDRGRYVDLVHDELALRANADLLAVYQPWPAQLEVRVPAIGVSFRSGLIELAPLHATFLIVYRFPPIILFFAPIGFCVFRLISDDRLSGCV